MNRAKRTFSAVVAGTIMTVAASISWAESAISDPPAFFAGLINPQASGTKVSGILTISLDLVPANEAVPPIADCELAINNIFVVTSLEGPIVTTTDGPTRFGIFSRDFTDHRLPPGSDPLERPFCLDDLGRQIAFVLALFTEEVIKYYFAPCIPGTDCPIFEVKDIRNFFQSGRGGYSMEITLAVGG